MLTLLTFALSAATHAPNCAAAVRIVIPKAHITAANAVLSSDSLRAFGRRPYCRIEATIDAETHIVHYCRTTGTAAS